MMKRTIAFLFCIIALLSCIVFAAGYHAKRTYQLVAKYDYECPMHLVDMYDIIMALAREHGRFPGDLASITNKLPISEYSARWRLHPVLCPGLQAPFDLKSPTADSFGYAYVDWSSKSFAHPAEVPGDYPLVYDRALTNHSGRGVFVLRVNGSVVWDPGAEWIRGFSHSHPEFRILSPE